MKRRIKSIQTMLRELAKHHKISQKEITAEAIREKYAADLNV